MYGQPRIKREQCIQRSLPWTDSVQRCKRSVFQPSKGVGMDKERYRFVVSAGDQATAGQASQALADMLRELDPVLDVDREKEDEATMDLGTIVNAIATSGATLAIAQGLAGWARERARPSRSRWTAAPGA